MTNRSDIFQARRPIRRVRDLDRGQWLLLGETLITLALGSAAIRLLPFRRVMKIASRECVSHPLDASNRVVDEVSWAVEAIARRVRWRTVCFQKGLALQLMLRRRGVPSILHYGVGKRDSELAAHVWISVDGRIVQGGDVADHFHCLASYPGP